MKLYVIHGSHPCATVEKALQLKGFTYKTRELPPLGPTVLGRVLFGKGQRTVPAIAFDDGTKLTGSRAIVRRLEEMRPEPSLFPVDPAMRARVEDAEEWGDLYLQSLARRLIWPAMKASPHAIASYSENSRLPLPAFMAKASAPLIARGEMLLNKAGPTLAQDLSELPGALDRIDGYIADGVIGGDEPNVADLQIAPSVRLLTTIEDLAPFLDGRPAKELAFRLFPSADGRMPAGSLPAHLLAAAR